MVVSHWDLPDLKSRGAASGFWCSLSLERFAGALSGVSEEFTLLAFLNCFRLARADVMVVAFVTTLAGVSFGRSLLPSDFLLATLLALVSTNSIYSLNAWADRRGDSLDKPERMIPSGCVPARLALVYGGVLTVAGFVYPFYFFDSWELRLLCWALPVIAVAYSLPPLHIKRRPMLAVLVTATGLTIPFQVGCHHSGADPLVFASFVPLVCMALAVVLLKDVSDGRGDVREGIRNLHIRFGSRLFQVSIAVAFGAVVLAVVAGVPDSILIFLLIGFGCVTMVNLRVLSGAVSVEGMYSRLTRSMVGACVLIFGFGMVLGWL